MPITCTCTCTRTHANRDLSAIMDVNPRLPTELWNICTKYEVTTTY